MSRVGCDCGFGAVQLLSSDRTIQAPTHFCVSDIGPFKVGNAVYSKFLKPKAMNRIASSLLTCLLSFGLMVHVHAQSFVNGNSSLPSTFNSGGCVGFADLDGDGYDDLVVLDQSRVLHTVYQTPTGGFVDYNLGGVSNSSQWGMCVGDFDNDGHKDVFSGGSYDGVHLMHITSPGQGNLQSLGNGSMFMQACNMADIDMDGVLDIFACHDDAVSRLWKGSEAGSMTNDQGLMALTSYDLGNYPNTDHSGNYGSVWTDFDRDGDLDLYIAKCRQFVSDPQDPRRINQLWVNDGQGNYTEEAAARGLVFFEQSWTADFADIDNDGDFDCLVTNHSTTLFLLENDGTGHFTDITSGSGLEVTGFFLQAKLEDFDNDGFVDLVYSGGAHAYFHNNGDQTFTAVPNMFPYGDTMHSFATGDINRDGQVDLYASYGNGYVNPDNGNPDVLWINEGNPGNHWITFELEGFQSNRDGVGATVEITGSFGTQVRSVRAGESYGMTSTFSCHFGLGASDVVETATVFWPSGLTTVLTQPATDQYHTVLEVPCTVPLEITATATQICPGESTLLMAPAGFQSYQWSDGTTAGNMLEVNEAGVYSLTAFNADGCAGISNSVIVEVLDGTVAPTVAVTGDEFLCAGSTWTLSASEGLSYLWSNGLTAASIEVGESGVYTVQVEDECGNVATSPEVNVTVFDGPTEAPATTPDTTLSAPAAVTLVASSAGADALRWFDAEVGGNLVADGPELALPLVSETTTYWVEASQSTTGPSGTGGELVTQPGGQYHTNSARWLEFDVTEPMRLVDVTLHANGTYDRSFEIIDAIGQVLWQSTVNVTDGEFLLEIGFELEPGTGYGLRCTTNNPQLWREGTASTLNYPYDLAGLGSITGSTVANTPQSYYYFFYTWNVESPLDVECVSPRADVTITVTDCTDPEACNYNPNATVDDGSCEYTSCGGSCLGDLNEDGSITVSDLLMILAEFGCVDACGADLDGDGSVSVADLLGLLSIFGGVC